MEDNCVLSSEFSVPAPNLTAEKYPHPPRPPQPPCHRVELLPQSQTRGSRPVTSTHFHPDQERMRTKTVPISPGQKAFLEESLAFAWFSTPNSIYPVAISRARGCPWLVPAAPRPGSSAGSALERSPGRLPSAEPPDDTQESVQESVRGQLRGRHLSTREQRRGR